MIAMSAGFSHCACVNQTGNLFTWGILQSSKNSLEEPKKIENFETAIVQISCSVGEKYCHTGCVDVEGRAYTWSSGYKGKLGHADNWSDGDGADETGPKMIQALKFQLTE